MLPDNGKVLFQEKRSPGLRRKSCVTSASPRTFQNVRGFPKMTALENVMVGCVFGARKPKNAREKARELLEFAPVPSSGRYGG